MCVEVNEESWTAESGLVLYCPLQKMSIVSTLLFVFYLQHGLRVEVQQKDFWAEVRVPRPTHEKMKKECERLCRYLYHARAASHLTTPSGYEKRVYGMHDKPLNAEESEKMLMV